MERDYKIDPVLKQWLDNVLVPAMVREYLALPEERDNVLGPPPEESDDSIPEDIQ
jgi:hypothetical protein